MKTFISGNLQFEPYRRTVQVESSSSYVAIEKGCSQRHIPPFIGRLLTNSFREILLQIKLCVPLMLPAKFTNFNHSCMKNIINLDILTIKYVFSPILTPDWRLSALFA